MNFQSTMNESSSRPILVTGSHRSGSTWVGFMLSSAAGVGYIHEPLSVNHNLGICSARIDYWFPYICETNAATYQDALKNCLQFRYQWGAAFTWARSVKAAGLLARDAVHFTECRSLKKRPLIKDPIAVFSVEWLARTFDVQPVIVIRHPLAFAGSLKKANWTHPFNHFIKQPLLMQDHLGPFEAEIHEYAECQKDIVDQAALLWNLIHYMIRNYQKMHPDWIYVKHETLSKEPLVGFEEIYAQLDLRFDDRVRNMILSYSTSQVKADNYATGSLKRNSRQNVEAWRQRLSKDEILRVRRKTEALASEFYHDEQEVLAESFY